MADKGKRPLSPESTLGPKEESAISTEPGTENVNQQQEEIAVASQWQLVWWKFRKHKVAMFSGFLLIVFYLIALFAEFIAPATPHAYNVRFNFAPPQRIHFVSAEGVSLRPFVYGYERRIDPVTLRRTYVPDTDQIYYIYFFVRGESYRFWGQWQTNLHLFGLADPNAPFYLLGADQTGRDVLSRIIYGARISLSIGLVGVFISLVLGVIIGGFAGYYGGLIDNLVQRLIELLRSMPTIPLWMALSAALPANWPALRVYFGITIILSFIGWTDLARVVRSKFLSLRNEDFVVAARLDAVKEGRIILKHMIPSFSSHIIASVTLAIPGMILAETALSFLGLGLRPPLVSWGVLMQQAQNIQSVAHAPWLLLPGVAVIITVLAFNFLGDGLRDAADPYAN